MTSLICSGFRPARSRTARITVAPSSGAAIFASDPPNLPTPVRAADTITTSVMSIPYMQQMALSTEGFVMALEEKKNLQAPVGCPLRLVPGIRGYPLTHDA